MSLRVVGFVGIGVAVLLLAMCVSGGMYPTPDAYVYQGLGRSLAEDGFYGNYRWEGSPPQIKYPPLYPLLLTGVEKFGRGSQVLLNGLGPLLLLLGVLALAARLGRLSWSRTGILLACALTVGNRYIQHYAWGTTSDVPYLGAVGAALLVFPFRRERPAWAWPLLGLILGVLSLGVRLTGIVLLISFALWLLARRRWVPALLLTLGFAVVLLGWLHYQGSQPEDYGDSYRRSLTRGSASGVLDRYLSRLSYLLGGLGVMLLPHANRLLAWEPAWVALGALLLLGAFTVLWRRRPSGALLFALYLLGNVGLICITHFYEHQRYLYPVYLIVVFVLMEGALGAGPRRRVAVLAVLGLLTYNLAVSGYGAVRSVRREVGLGGEPAVSRARVEQSGAAAGERKVILAMMDLAKGWGDGPVALVHCPDLATRSYASFLLPGEVGVRRVRTREEAIEYLEAASNKGRVYLLRKVKRRWGGVYKELVDEGRLVEEESHGQPVFIVYRFR